MHPKIDACAPGDGKGRICPVIVERPFDSDLALSKDNCPEAFPFGLPNRNSTNAGAIIRASLLFVSGIKNRIVEGKYITQRVSGRVKLLIGVCDGMFDDV